MRGSVVFQVQTVFEKSGINQIGTSKHDAKVSAKHEGAKTWHEVGKGIGIHSYATADAYRDVWRDVCTHTREESGVKDIEKIEANHIKVFLESKIEAGVAHSTFMQYAAACEKLETALNLYSEKFNTGSSYNFSDHKEVRATAHVELSKFDGSRAYERPVEVINSIVDERHKIAAAVQYEGGARVSEANKIKENQLKGFHSDKITKEIKGIIHLDNTKGGLKRDIQVGKETYQRLEEHIKEHGRFEFDKNAYRQDIKNAAEISRQTYNGSHGLRWNYAQERHQELQQHGCTYEQSISEISHEMGHHRADITEYYLR